MLNHHLLITILACLLGIQSSCNSEPAFDDSRLVLAEHAFNQGDYVTAEPLLIQILRETETSGIRGEKMASTLYYLGELYRLQGKVERAEPYFWKALPVWAKTVGATHPKMAKGLTSLAYVYESKREYAKAEPLVKQALKVREKAFGVDHPNIVPSLEQYGALLNLMDREAEARGFLTRAQTILAKHSHS